MQWADEAIVLSVRPHAETSAVVEVFARNHGRHLGLVHGGRSRKARPVLQTGNHVDVTWRARLSEHLGNFTLEPRRAFAAEVMDDPAALAGLASLAALARQLPERDPHPNLYEVTVFVLSFLDDPSVWPALMVRWELALLDELGFGLDLSSCAATGATTGLVYVSPRSGRAVSAAAGEPYKDKLLALPDFLVDRTAPAARADTLAGLDLTAHFLMTRVFAPNELSLPAARVRLREVLARP
ncbi:MAG: DNA repair protein RecO [Hyphomicrobiales bacterium]|nr:DNA repair protein RecO [Hyphomicrobiales bacterium]